MSYIIPVLIVALFLYGLIKNIDPYGAFVAGAKDAIPTLIGILPNLAAILAAIAVFRASGCAEAVSSLLRPIFEFIGIPAELSTLMILRPFSGSGTLALLADILNTYGADSFIGLSAAVCVGSTETIMYTIALYCGSVGITKSRHAIPAALISGLAGSVCGIALVRLMLR